MERYEYGTEDNRIQLLVFLPVRACLLGAWQHAGLQTEITSTLVAEMGQSRNTAYTKVSRLLKELSNFPKEVVQ